MKSTLPDIGKLKREYQQENEKLRVLNKNGSLELIDDNRLHLGFMFSSPLILKV